MTFTYQLRPNRVDSTSDNILKLSMPRIGTITSETGAITTVTLSDPECVRGSKMPSSEDADTLNCYPTYWHINGATEASLDWFHKYRVTAVLSTDPTGRGQGVQTSYSYADPAWHYNFDPLIPADERIWSQWRGYGKVTATTGAAGTTQSKTVSLYMQGMDGDKQANGTSASATVTGIDTAGLDVADITDNDEDSGFLREQITYDGSTPIATTVNTPWSSQTASQQKSYASIKAYYVRNGATSASTYLTASATWRTHTVTTDYDSYGMATQVADTGQTGVSGDNTCTRYWYARNLTIGLTGLVSRTRSVGKDCSTAETDLNLPNTSVSRGDVLADTAVVYDNTAATAWSATQTPSLGDATWTGRASAYPAAVTSGERYPSAWQTVSTSTFDDSTGTAGLGRPLTVTDAAGNTTTTTYTGPLTKTDCGRSTPPPACAGPQGRVCHRCASRRRAVACTRCGRIAPPEARRPEGPICAPCKDKEPESRKECAGCRRMMVPARRLPDGTYQCQTCAPKKLQTCCRCGRRRRANALTPEGPICGGCYSSPPRRCGICGREALINTRANADTDTPDTCYRCRKRTYRRCHACGRVRPGQHINHGNGPWHCDSCVPREARKRRRHQCVLCGQDKSVGVFWPMGPVCHACYLAARSSPGPCASCGDQRILMGRTSAGKPICRSCCFPDEPPEVCTTCHQTADLLPGRQCPRCTLTAHVTGLLSQDGAAVVDWLQPLAEALTGADNPYPILAWLRSPAARLLGQLTLQPGTVDHAALDALPPGHATAYVRSLLTTAGILPPRDENLALLTNWAARTLARLPPHHAAVIRPFAEWHIIRDARRVSARHRYTYAAHKAHCSNIRAAIDFLTWLETQHLTLETLQQQHLDTWAADRPTLRVRSIRFIRWASARHLTRPGLSIQYPPSQMPATFQPEHVQHEELRRCLNDSTLPLDVRITGALVRLYALPLTRIVRLTAGDVHRDDHYTYLTLSRHPVVLPPKLAELVDDQLARSGPLHRSPGANRYLVPGFNPGRPRNPAGLSQAMARHGLPGRAARNTALMEALADLPPMIVADLFGMATRTAERWATFAGSAWADYLAASQSTARAMSPGPRQ